MTYAKIVDHPNLVRDMDSHAVLNIDITSKKMFLSSRDAKRKERERLDRLEGEVADLKKMLQLVLDKLG